MTSDNHNTLQYDFVYKILHSDHNLFKEDNLSIKNKTPGPNLSKKPVHVSYLVYDLCLLPDKQFSTATFFTSEEGTNLEMGPYIGIQNISLFAFKILE